MEISVFLAKLIGLYLLVVGFVCLFRKRQIMHLGKDLLSSIGALAVSGEISLILGLVIAIDHSIWEVSWRGLITLIGYLLILRGVLRFAFPAQVKKFGNKLLKAYWLIILVMLAVGAYLTYCGFTAQQLSK